MPTPALIDDRRADHVTNPVQRFTAGRLWLTILVGVSSLVVTSATVLHGCTTAVISGRVTPDGRPLLWKNRDTTSSVHNEVVVIDDGPLRAIGVINAGHDTSVWMGMNEAGFCIENSLSLDLRDDDDQRKGLGNGALMKKALQSCRKVEDFRRLLEQTNAFGRSTAANFGVIDASGGASVFETGPNQFQEFDINDPVVAPDGFLVRTNFATTAKALPADPDADSLTDVYSGVRYCRADDLLSKATDSGGTIDLRFVLRHLARDMADTNGVGFPGTINGQAGPLPPVIPIDKTISRRTTVSAVVFHGVQKDEPCESTTMWTILGDPKYSIAVPVEMRCRVIADPLEGSRGGEIGEIALTLRDWTLTKDRHSIHTDALPGIWADLWPIEDQLIRQNLEHRDRMLDTPGSALQASHSQHERLAAKAYTAMRRELVQAKHAALQHATKPDESESLVPQSRRAAGSDGVIHVAIYDHAESVHRRTKTLLSVLTSDHGFQCDRVSPGDIRDGVLSGYDVLVMPGGSASGQSKKLQDQGREQIRRFVDSGGGYLGICAGAYLATAHYDWSLGLIDARVWDRIHWARGNGPVTVSLSEMGQQCLGISDSRVDVDYAQGPLLVPGRYDHLPDYNVIAKFQTAVAQKGAHEDAMAGTHAVIHGEFGDGQVVCISPHPEFPGGPNQMVRAAVRLVAGDTEDDD
ncbi:BPL-N domain-containing protein [Crateriforma conspicua]|uniref:Biotin-protein ligase N-terminal domain-containing protein n=1 Tax=Crateriforma conspicua TaxID=2527996 RepID=A0A5C6FTW2_9PLAN|nr:BPL-N domain-containing protein [Crateriforma conspicua]TWU64918.1 hypothetical protein V7x_04620 [Crateriforma conspicua]